MGVEVLSHPFLAFSNKELPLEGAIHTRPLQITIKCMGAKVSMVLIDNGSTLIVCFFRSTLTIGLDVETIIPSPLTIRAYDNTSRKVIMEFHVMDITPNYNLILGRAWFHPTEVVPYSLHQKMKIIWKGGIAVIIGDSEILAPVCGLEKEESEQL